MKFYSEILDEVFDNLEEAERKEEKFLKEQKEKEERKKILEEQKEKRLDEIEKSFDHTRELISKYIEDYGVFKGKLDFNFLD